MIFALFHSAQLLHGLTLIQIRFSRLGQQGDNDPLVKKSESYDVLYNELKNRGNISFHLETNKWHNPNYTEDSVKYKDSYVALAVSRVLSFVTYAF